MKKNTLQSVTEAGAGQKETRFFETEVEEVKAPGDKPGLMKFTVSTEDRDRHGDVVVADGWKLANYKKNPVMLWAHDYSRPPIGKAVDIGVEDGKLKAMVEFVPAHIDPFAEQIRQLYLGKFMRTTSVGFIAYKREALTEDDLKQRPDQKYGDRLHGELLEFSAVPVPANPMALQNNGFMQAMAKGFAVRPSGVLVPTKTGLHSALMVKREDQEEMDLRLIRASAALLLGARGGLAIAKEQAVEQFNLLREEARALGDESMDVIVFDIGVTQDENYLRQAFDDVWDEELLDLVARSKEVAPVAVGEMTPEQEAKAVAVVQAMAKNLDAVKAALK